MPNFLIFESESVKYAVPVESVESIFWMPELSPIEAAPPWFVGLVNWHGEIVHVLDLGLRFKHAHRSYKTSTNIILLSTPQMRCGIIADAVLGLFELTNEAVVQREIVMPSDFSSNFSDLIYGEIKQGDEIILLLSLDKLLTTQLGVGSVTPNEKSVFELKAEAKLIDQDILRARMHQLATPVSEMTNENKEGFALVRIGGMRYAIEIAYITEFSHLKQCVNLPCSPEYILGVINLRGEILSVIDMTTLLNISDIVDKQDIVILQFESKRLALAVQKVEDFQYFDRSRISAVQNVEEYHAKCKSLLRVDDEVAGILDIEAILLGSLLEVDELI